MFSTSGNLLEQTCSPAKKFGGRKEETERNRGTKREKERLGHRGGGSGVGGWGGGHGVMKLRGPTAPRKHVVHSYFF